jgi:ubiquinone/menaquinone biosynthesis C-methylase UbiE
MHDAYNDNPSTYWVQDRSNKEEMARLRTQDQMLTADMGGVLPEQADPSRFQSVLDVGCGIGNWLIEAAKTYPNMSKLVGIDVSERMIRSAREEAKVQAVNERVEFHVMDALRKLEFPDASFDLVNHRLGAGYLRTWEWPHLLQEYWRVCRLGGTIRITECNVHESNSQAVNRLTDLFTHALSQSGHLLIEGDKNSVINGLADLLSRHAGISDVQTRAYTLEYRTGTPPGQRFYEDSKLLFRTFVPFIRKWSHLPDDYEALYQQALREMQQPDFLATWCLLTAWGTKKS